MKKIALTAVACFSVLMGGVAHAQDTVVTEPVVPEQVVPPAAEVPPQTVPRIVHSAPRDAITNEVIAQEPEKKVGEKKSLRNEVRGKMKKE